MKTKCDTCGVLVENQHPEVLEEMAFECPYCDSPTWPFVLAFARQMEAKLAENRHKGDRLGWVNCLPLGLFSQLHIEVEELSDAMQHETALDVMREAADVANMAMMTADAFDPAILECEK